MLLELIGPCASVIATRTANRARNITKYWSKLDRGARLMHSLSIYACVTCRPPFNRIISVRGSGRKDREEINHPNRLRNMDGFGGGSCAETSYTGYPSDRRIWSLSIHFTLTAQLVSQFAKTRLPWSPQSMDDCLPRLVGAACLRYVLMQVSTLQWYLAGLRLDKVAAKSSPS